MSTYLLAFIVAELDYVEAFTKVGTPIPCRVYAPKGTAHLGSFSLDICTKTLDLFNELFGSPYPLPKMDMVAVADFDSNAMENWGLITYSTNILLFDEETTTLSSKQTIAGTVTHELSHQWFGNLVTMEWWNDLWLNEGFATWVGNYAVDKLFPEWKYWDTFVVDDVLNGLNLDCLRSSHPIEADVEDPSEIDQIFDDISYSKGASIIRMLSTYLTEDVFFEGIRQYLKKHAYGNASTADLWAQLSETSGQDVSEFMNLWTKQAGYPVLRAEREGNTLQITQTRFLSSGDISEEEKEQFWWNPLGLLTTGQTKASQEILHEKTTKIELPEGADYFILNYGFSSLFRVQYPEDNLKKLGELIAKKEVLTSVDRVYLVSNAGSLAVGGYGSTNTLLEFLLNFRDEEEYVVWREIANQFSNLSNALFDQPEEVQNLLKKYRLELFSGIANRVGWEEKSTDNASTPLLREIAITNAGKAGDAAIVAEAKDRFKRYTEGDLSAIPSDLTAAVYSIVLLHGGKDEHESIKKIYLETTGTDQKLVAMAALGATPHGDLIQETLTFGLTDDVRAQDLFRLIAHCGNNPKGRHTTWNFVKENWDLLPEEYGQTPFSMNIILKYVTEFSSQSDLDDLNEFFSDKDTSIVEMTLSQSLESIAINASWVQRDSENIRKWLEANLI
jgi:aminopeptidase 2